MTSTLSGSETMMSRSSIGNWIIIERPPPMLNWRLIGKLAFGGIRSTVFSDTAVTRRRDMPPAVLFGLPLPACRRDCDRASSGVIQMPAADSAVALHGQFPADMSCLVTP